MGILELQRGARVSLMINDAADPSCVVAADSGFSVVLLRRQNLLPLALRIVREERRVAGLSVFDRAPKNKHGWQRVSGPRVGGRRVVRS